MIEKQIKLKNNETIYYLQKGNTDNVLLLIHGNTSSGIFFEPLFDLFPEDITLIVPDMRGFGKSSYNTKIETINDFSVDLKYFLDELNYEKIDILGWSLGGAIAMDFASTYPDMVKNLILLSSGSLKGYPTFKKDEKGQPKFPEIYSSKEELAMDFVQILPLLHIYETKNYENLKAIFDYVIYTGKNKPTEEQNFRWFSETMKQRNLVDVNWALANFNLSDSPSFYSQGNGKINNLKAKSLILWGDKDVTVPKYMFDENVAGIKGAEVKVYEGCGHSLIVDEPDRLVKDIIDFIK
jgi:pimeloyl-ACP methyl ester carboxylesterase